MSERRVEVLVFDGCPNVDLAVERVRAAVASTSMSAAVRIVRVESDEHARHLRFLGSPTVRVDGADVEPAARDREDYGLQCRVYSTGVTFQGAPPSEWIASALRGEAPRG